MPFLGCFCLFFTIQMNSFLYMEQYMLKFNIEVSLGDLVDRTTIILVKAEKTDIEDSDSYKSYKEWLKSASVHSDTEITTLKEFFDHVNDMHSLLKYFGELANIHRKLWDLENTSEDLYQKRKANTQSGVGEIVDTWLEIKQLNKERAEIKHKLDKLIDPNDTTNIKIYKKEVKSL